MVAIVTPAEHAHLTSRSPRRAAALVWIAPRNRTTGQIEPSGFWTGPDHREFVIEGAQRLYYGAGGLLGLDPLRSVMGTDVQETTLRMALPTPEVEMAIRGYNLSQAEVQIHRALFDPVTLALIGISLRFEGWVDRINITDASEDSAGECKLTLTGSARAGTKKLSLKKSDASQRLRKLASGGEDRFYQYADISGAVPLKWGVK